MTGKWKQSTIRAQPMVLGPHVNISERSRKFYDGTYAWDSEGFIDEIGVYRRFDSLNRETRAPTPLPPMDLGIDEDEDEKAVTLMATSGPLATGDTTGELQGQDGLMCPNRSAVAANVLLVGLDSHMRETIAVTDKKGEVPQGSGVRSSVHDQDSSSDSSLSDVPADLSEDEVDKRVIASQTRCITKTKIEVQDKPAGQQITRGVARIVACKKAGAQTPLYKGEQALKLPNTTTSTRRSTRLAKKWNGFDSR